MISIVNPREVEQLLRPTVYRPSAGAAGASDGTRELADEIRPSRRPVVADRADEHRFAELSANPSS